MKRNLKAPGFLLAALLLASLMLGLSAVPAAEASSSNWSAQLTYGANYDRNPSVLKAKDGTYWLFFARTTNCTSGHSTCDVDNTQYNIYYMNSRDYHTWTSPKRLSDRAGLPDTFRGRTIAATQAADGKISVFWANGGFSSSFYFYSFAPNARPDADVAPLARGEMSDHLYFNVEAVTANGKIWVFYEDTAVPGVYVRSFDGTNWSTSTLVALDLSIPKAIVDGNTFRVVMVNGSTGEVFITSALVGNSTWAAPISVIAPHSGVTNWDPTIFKDAQGKYNVFYAPDLGTGEQRIEWKQSSNPNNWSGAAKVVTHASSGTNSWWDYWPEATSIGNDTYLLYTSEKNGNTQGSGHIFVAPLNWKTLS